MRDNRTQPIRDSLSFRLHERIQAGVLDRPITSMATAVQVVFLEAYGKHIAPHELYGRSSEHLSWAEKWCIDNNVPFVDYVRMQVATYRPFTEKHKTTLPLYALSGDRAISRLRSHIDYSERAFQRSSHVELGTVKSRFVDRLTSDYQDIALALVMDWVDGIESTLADAVRECKPSVGWRAIHGVGVRASIRDKELRKLESRVTKPVMDYGKVMSTLATGVFVFRYFRTNLAETFPIRVGWEHNPDWTLIARAIIDAISTKQCKGLSWKASNVSA